MTSPLPRRRGSSPCAAIEADRSGPPGRAGLPLGLVLLGALVGAPSCRAAAPTPGQVLHDYGAAVAQGRWSAAYRHLSADYRARVSLAEYTATMQAVPERSLAVGRALAADGPRRARRVLVELPQDERAVLVREGDGWRLGQPPYHPFDLGTPKSALRAFIWAVKAKRYDRVVELAPASYRAELDATKVRRYWETRGSESTRALLSALHLVLDAPIVEEGDQAYASYAEDRMVRWVRESDGWRIASPE